MFEDLATYAAKQTSAEDKPRSIRLHYLDNSDDFCHTADRLGRPGEGSPLLLQPSLFLSPAFASALPKRASCQHQLA